MPRHKHNPGEKPIRTCYACKVEEIQARLKPYPTLREIIEKTDISIRNERSFLSILISYYNKLLKEKGYPLTLTIP